MTFPDTRYASAGAYADAYFERYARAAASLDRARLDAACRILDECYAKRRWVYVCGNGGSAGIAGHFLCDHLKGIQTDTQVRPRVNALSSHLEIVTAIANDISYAEVFAYQLRTIGEAGDVLITISASGDSENVVRAMEWAKANGLKTIAMTGFAGGRTGKLADVDLHVAGDNYGVVEDLHQSIMHILAQYMRMKYMNDETIAVRKF